MATAVQQIKTYRLEPDQRGAEASVRATIAKANGGAASIGIINLPRRLTRT